MASDYYSVLEIGPDWESWTETMGSKEKYWYQQPSEDALIWLFKYPRRPTSGEHWAEKIAFEIADLLEIPCAYVELAVLQEAHGSASLSFVSHGQQLFHGNQILARHMEGYNPEAKRFEDSRHTLHNIWMSLERVFEDPEGADAAKSRFAKFLVLDALIGNTDRHHENWGVVRRRTEDGRWVGYLAPSFDHASSLGRELLDKRRVSLMANNPVEGYFEKGKGRIYWSESDDDGPSPLELVRRAAREFPDLLGPALTRLKDIEEAALREIVESVPPGWMTDAARRFAIQLISYNCKQLKELY